jgi:hypothetical protein
MCMPHSDFDPERTFCMHSCHSTLVDAEAEYIYVCVVLEQLLACLLALLWNDLSSDFEIDCAVGVVRVLHVGESEAASLS